MSRHRILSIVVRVAELGLGALFLYLGTTKFLGAGAATVARLSVASAEMLVGILILTRVSGKVSTPVVVVVAAAEVALFGRPPLAAMACVSAHGLTTWGRIALHHDKFPVMTRLYMVVEHFRNGDAVSVYRRFRAQGRMAPEGVTYVSSWVDERMERCYQLMETDDRALLDQWIANWSDLVEFEVHPVMTSADAAARIGPRL
jgi:hypothetical protein